jgi:oligosaccharyltransferase complex subunit gamma
MPRNNITLCQLRVKHFLFRDSQFRSIFTMRLASLIIKFLLPLATLAAKKSTSDRFSELYSKSLPAKLDDDSFQSLTATPRDFSSAILLTALEPKFGCAACREFQPEWELLARSWQKGDKSGESRIVFGTLDFLDGKGTFQSVLALFTNIVKYIAS